MGNAQKAGLAVIAMAVGLGLGYVVFRPTLKTTPLVLNQALVASDSAVSRAAAPRAPSAELLTRGKATREAENDREARTLEIDQEIRSLPEEDSEKAPDLAHEIGLRREQVEELKSRVAELDRALGLVSGATVADPQKQLELEARVAALQGKLNDARESLSEQKRKIGWIAASNDPGVNGALSTELARRAAVVEAIRREMHDLFSARQSELQAAQMRRAANTQMIRTDRNAVAQAYNEAVSGLLEAQNRYQRLLLDSAASRKSARTLSEEKASRLGR